MIVEPLPMIQDRPSDEGVDLIEANERRGGEVTSAVDETPYIVPESANSLTLEVAKARISPEIMAALQKNFNGEIVSVRKTDERDLIF